jgi:D-glycero-alpha-D-manno-heptose 1-phosphate guanylyltransferase
MIQKQIGVIILAGGFGTRIRKELGLKPKPLAMVLKKPFLHWIIKYLKKYNLKNIIITTHYQYDQVNKYINQIKSKEINVTSIVEETPLGTGGSIINAIIKTKAKYKYYLVLNGDSLLFDDLNNLFDISSDRTIDASLYAVFLDDTSRYGTIEFSKQHILRGFREKAPGSGYINAGIYFFKTKFLKKFLNHKEKFSIEQDFFPMIVNSGYKIKTYLSNANFIDIGTPQSLNEADVFIKTNYDKL